MVLFIMLASDSCGLRQCIISVSVHHNKYDIIEKYNSKAWKHDCTERSTMDKILVPRFEDNKLTINWRHR